MAATLHEATQPVHGSHARVRRDDVQGLRALAVGLVIAYHAGVPFLPGGYIGVDVFFVISGFLITGLLCRELDSTGTLRLGRFWARRVRRLLPAAALVLVVTLCAARLVLPPLARVDVAADATATSLFAGNMWFAWTGTAYLADQAPSVLLHYWSLAVEEQYYALIPLLVLALSRSRRALTWALATISVGSFLLCIVVTTLAQPWAFFSLPTRAWELGAGGLAALAVPRLTDWGPSRRAAALLGLAAVGCAAVLYDESTVFPGVAAALPVVGTAVVLVAGAVPGPGRVQRLAHPGLVRLGDWSYSLYLWHWPLLVIPALAAPGRDSTPAERGVAVVAAVVLAALTYRFVEDPLRHHARLREPGRSPVLAGALVAACVTASIGVGHLPVLHAAKPVAAGIAEPPSFVPSNLRPPLEEAIDDLPRVYDDGCHAGFRETRAEVCSYGDGAAGTVLLLGDSHAAQWQPALETAAADLGMRLDVLTKSSCPFVSVTVQHELLHRSYDECDDWRRDALTQVQNRRPSILVLTSFWDADLGADAADSWIEGLHRTVELAPSGTRVIVLGDTPSFPLSPTVCLSGHVRDTAACTSPVDEVTDGRHQAREQRAAQEEGALWVDTRPWICPNMRCDALYGDVLVYRDRHHLTTTFAKALAPRVANALTTAAPAIVEGTT